MEKEMEIFIEAAEQLQALKATLVEQQGSSARLRGLSDTLEQVSAQIARIPSGLSSVLMKAEAVEQRITAASSKVEALKDGIPAIVERIEQSDVGKSVDALASDVARSRNDLMVFRDSISKIDELVQQFRLANEAVFQELRVDFGKSVESQDKVNASVYALRAELLAKLDAMENRLVSTEQISEKSIGTTGKAFELITGALRTAGERHSTGLQGLQRQMEALREEEISEMRKELKAISEQLLHQGAAIDVLSKKKGFSF